MKRPMTWAAVAAASLLVLGACGNGDNGDDKAATNGDTNEVADGNGGEEEPEELVLGLVPSQDMDQLVEEAEVLGELLGEELGIQDTTHAPEAHSALLI